MAIIYDPRGNEFFGDLDQIGNQPVSDTRPASVAIAGLNGEVVMDLNGHATASIDIRGTFVGTVVYEGSVDGINYVAIPLLVFTTGAYVMSSTAPVFGFLSVAGYRCVRVRASAFTSGAIMCAMRATKADYSILVERIAATSGLTATAAAGAAATLTLPAPGAGLFQYVDWIRIEHFATALLTAAAAPVIVTTTNLPGTPSFNFRADAAPQGTLTEKLIQNGMPIRAITANTTATIVAPATTGVIWKITASYRVGA